MVRKMGGAIILDEDDSGLVVLPYEKYVRLLEGEKREEEGAGPKRDFSMEQEEQKLIERLNRDIALLKEEIRKKELQELAGNGIID